MRLCLTTPVLPAFFIALSALLAGCSSTPRASEEGNAATETSGQVAFDLTVKAPDDVQKYLERYVELQRYRQFPGLQLTELTRLLGAADAIESGAVCAAAAG